MNRRIAMSALSIIAALTLMGGSAFAAFTATASATDTTFSTTNPALLVKVNDGTEGSSVAGPIVTGLVPGVPGAGQAFVLHNTDTDPSADLSTSLKLTVKPANTLPGADLTITVNCGAGDITDTYSGWITTGHGIGTVVHGGTLTCTMTPTLNSGVGNSDAGKSAVFDAVFTGTAGS